MDDELEFTQGDEAKDVDKHEILQENLLPKAESTPELATPHRLENQPRNEEMEATKRIDWSLYAIPMQATTTKEDAVIEHMQKVRAQCDRLLEVALDNLPDRDLIDKAYFTRVITPGLFSHLS